MSSTKTFTLSVDSIFVNLLGFYENTAKPKLVCCFTVSMCWIVALHSAKNTNCPSIFVLKHCITSLTSNQGVTQSKVWPFSYQISLVSWHFRTGKTLPSFKDLLNRPPQLSGILTRILNHMMAEWLIKVQITWSERGEFPWHFSNIRQLRKTKTFALKEIWFLFQIDGQTKWL